MADRKASESDIVYDPVRLHPDGALFDRIDLEDILDKDYRPEGINPETGKPFNIYDIQPQPQLRMQMRQRVAVVRDDEYDMAGTQNVSIWHSSVIHDYPFEILNETHMSDYVHSLVRWIARDISLQRDSKVLWKTLNLLRLNCQYSDANKILFRSVNGFVTLIRPLSRHFYSDELQGSGTVNPRDDKHIVNVCREIVKLAEITDITQDWVLDIDITQPLARGFCAILRKVFFGGGYRNDTVRIVRIVVAMNHIPHFGIFRNLIFEILNEAPSLPSEALSRCADIVYGYCTVPYRRPFVVNALYNVLKVLVYRFYNSGETNANKIRDRVRFWASIAGFTNPRLARVMDRFDEEYSDRSAALEKCLKILCELCAQNVSVVVELIVDARHNLALHLSNLILKFALLHIPEEKGKASSFSGKHLLYAMIINKYILVSTAGEGMSPEDIKVVFEFAMSSLPARSLFNGRPRLKELTDEVVDIMLNFPRCKSVLSEWSDLPF